MLPTVAKFAIEWRERQELAALKAALRLKLQGA
jgi:hypothetical protein